MWSVVLGNFKSGHPETELLYGTLGKAAFKCDEHALAEGFFLKFRDNHEDWHRGEEMRLLAEIWCNCDKRADAQKLPLDCLRKRAADSKTATGSDKRLFENWFQSQRAAFLRLFTPDSEAVLASEGIPDSTLV